MRFQLFLILCCLQLIVTPAWAEPVKVLFDQGHGQAFIIEQSGDLQLGKFADLFRRAGCDVTSTKESLTTTLLAEYDALVISGAFKPFSESEIDAVEAFIQQGGRVAVTLHIAPPLISLLHRVGIVTATGVVHEGVESLILDEQSINFTVSDLAAHPLTAGLKYFSLYGGWPLLASGENVRVVASSSKKAWVDLNRDQIFSTGDAVQKFSLVVSSRVGRGEIIVFADDAIFQNRFLVGENRKLAENLIQWMKSGLIKDGITI